MITMLSLVLGLWSGVAVAAEPAPLILDKATEAELAALDAVDEEQARAIVGLRAARGGRIASVEELRILPGMGEETLSSLRRSTEVELHLPTGERRQYNSVEEVMAAFAHEPSVQQVQGWAADYAKVNPRLVDSWLAASRTFALLPELRFEYRLRGGWDQGFEYYPVDGTIDHAEDDVFSALDDASKDQDQYYTVKANWDLDKLIMSSERIRVINEAQDIVKLRDKVLSEATRVYFERRRVQIDMLISPKRDVQGQVKDELRLLELTATLDALTGGRLSAALAK